MLAKALFAIWVFFLTVKNYQEIGNVRVISTLLPVIFLAGLFFKGTLRVPPAVLLYIVYVILVSTVSSFINPSTILYSSYYVIQVLCAVIAVEYFRNFINSDSAKIPYFVAWVFSTTILFNIFTLTEQWHGGYVISSFSDFSTFYAMQLSFAFPLISVNPKIFFQAVVLVVLFFCFSRISLFLSVLVFIRQNITVFRWRNLLVAVALFSSLAYTFTLTNAGSAMFDKTLNKAHDFFSPVDVEALNPSDRGRRLYSQITLDNVDANNFIFGNGIKTNANIIFERFDPKLFGLDDWMRIGTVHNVYLEMLSDIGYFGLSIFVGFVFYILYYFIKCKLLFSELATAFLVFITTYLFEANYVSFYFQFIIVAYLFISSRGRFVHA